MGVATSTEVVKALAFVDSGSDTTLVKERFADKHQLAKDATSLAVSTVGGTQVMTAVGLRLQLISLDTNEEIEPTEAFTLVDLPMQAPRSVNAILTRWPHLRDVTVVDWEDDEVDLLIGCDVLEAHLVLDQRVGDHQAPYAVHTALGWMLYGPEGDVVP